MTMALIASSSPIPGMPHGKPAGVRCVQLDEALRCKLFGRPERPAVCASLRPSFAMCGATRADALRFLEAGATAFVGCTGAHYSPREKPYHYFGGPMHEAFWRGLGTGQAPAEALLAAKAEYVRDFPHGMRSEAQHAIEYKTLHQYTCLGLGW